MKKYYPLILIILGLGLVGSAYFLKVDNIALSAGVFIPVQGGTGTSTSPTADQILIGGDTANQYDVKTLTDSSHSMRLS